MPNQDSPAAAPVAQRDAVCFTSGPAGAFFSAGVIHAHLAADRPAPAVVAGISTGSISAAAMQRAYKSLREKTRRGNPAGTEAGRWQWLRHYISHLIDQPANVFWDSLPNPTDFFAEQNQPSLHDPSLTGKLPTEEMHANRQEYLLTNLGTWFAQLPIKVSTIATGIVRYVRYKEEYSGHRTTRKLNFYGSVVVLCFQLIWHIILHPVWVRESALDNTVAARRPLLGWEVYIAAWLAVLLTIGSILLFVFGHFLLGVVIVLVVFLAFNERLGRPMLVVLRKALLGPALASVGFGRSLLHNFHLRRRLMDVFEQDAKEPGIVDEDPMPILLVTAPLQTFYDSGKCPVASRQLWPQPKGGVTLVDALLASTSGPGVWPPHVLEKSITKEGTRFDCWDPLEPSDPQPAGDQLDLVDGASVRKNPLPALLEFLQRRPDIRDQIERKSPDGTWPAEVPPSIHVVYSVPLFGPKGDGRMPDKDANIANVALSAVELAARRDTRMEVDQLNCVSRLELEVRNAGTQTAHQVTVAFADQIAPSAEPAIGSDFSNPLNPDPKSALTKIAEGCRCTLEKLYQPGLQSYTAGDIHCNAFLRTIAPARPWEDCKPLSSGLPEVCDHCTRQLRRPPAPKQDKDTPKSQSLLSKFPNTLGVYRTSKKESSPEPQPRIVFVWSGGVFRGSFHIGMIGALLHMNVKPDLIAGASVGTLMGGAIAAMFASPAGPKRDERLRDLVALFKEVDKRVALTRTLKEATRDLGIRGRQIRLSPAMIRDMVLCGTQADAGYAATGAPPALIDAISSLLSIPLEETRKIAGDFIAGLVADAAHSLLKSVKEHTLARLSIETCVLGASLLQIAARKLIDNDGVDLYYGQPFWRHEIAFLATTTNLGAQSRVVLWDQPSEFDKPYDFLQAALSSSAFPAVFAPRRASEVFPGWGRRDVRFSDGGMFDNLPFVPAIDALCRAQRDESAAFERDPARMVQYVKDRHENPDLFLAGALDANPENSPHPDGPFNYFNQISARAVSLGNNSKIRSFINTSEVGYRQFGTLNQALQSGAKPQFRSPSFVRTYVNAAVLPVFPTDNEHLNPTFAFCKSTGMESERLERSIADGCYQGFKAFSVASPSAAVQQSLKRLREVGRIPNMEHNPRNLKEEDTACPFFTMDGQPFACRFAGIDDTKIRQVCVKDDKHV